MRAVNYLRYSSHNQDEFSIEGQRQENMSFISKNNYTFVGEYCDRAKSGTKDDRKDFLRMFEDAKKGLFDCVVVYKLNRFARNRTDSAIYRNELKKMNIKVISATEGISDTPEGVILESVLEGLNEYFSLNLGQDVKRGMGQNAENCYYNGGTVPFGLKLEVLEIPDPAHPNKPIIKKKYIIDEEKAPYVVKIYDMYIERTTMADIIIYLNKMGVKTANGQKFNRSSIRKILTNKKYIGIYSYNGIETPDGIPRIISDETFQRVQDELVRNGLAPSRNRAKTEYLLTTKLYCGECKGKMTGKSGTSKSGRLHTYYKCVNTDNKKVDSCSNKIYQTQEDIESFVAMEAQKFINYENIDFVANEVARISKDEQDNTEIRFLERNLRDAEKKKENAIKTLLVCDDDIVRKVLIEEVSKAETAKIQYQQQLLVEKSKHEIISARELKYFFKKLGKGNINDKRYRKMLINTLINRVYLWYNKVAIVINIGGVEKEIEIHFAEEDGKCSLPGGRALPSKFKGFS